MKLSSGMKAGVVAIASALIMAGCASNNTRYAQSSDGYPTDNPRMDNIPDAVPKKEPLAASGNAPSYEVLGKTYHVLPSAKGYNATGVASFYGTKFNGYKTSDGETYDMYAMTAASKVLPLPTYVRVTNLNNNRSVIVRVNDRGPFNSRIMDLSYAAAYKLGYVQQGTAPVRVEAIDPDTYQQQSAPARQQAVASTQSSSTASDDMSSSSASSLMANSSDATTTRSSGAGSSTSTSNAGEVYLQVASVTDQAQAEQTRSRLAQSLGVHGRVEQFQNFYRIQMGPFASGSAVYQARERLGGLGYPNAFVVH